MKHTCIKKQKLRQTKISKNADLNDMINKLDLIRKINSKTKALLGINEV